MKDLQEKNNKNQINLESLNDFLLEKEDDTLDFLLQIKGLKEIDFSSLKINKIFKHYLNILSTEDDDYFFDINTDIPKGIMNNYNFIRKAIFKTQGLILRNVNKDINNYYKLLKLAYRKNKDIIEDEDNEGNEWFPKEYIPQLIKDFPEDKQYLETFLIKEYISKEVKKLLKEYYLNKNNNKI